MKGDYHVRVGILIFSYISDLEFQLVITQRCSHITAEMNNIFFKIKSNDIYVKTKLFFQVVV